MKKVKFIFAIHNHQPVGNFGFVSEDAYQRAYLPLVEALKDNPWFKISLHYTGKLLEWLEEVHPDFIRTLKEMSEAGQVEVMSGGFYEPILALLPDTDKVGQIKKLTSYVSERFGREPKGMWLAERVWEPHLPRPISEAGIDYVVVDDFHFKMSGLRDSDLTGYFLTEEQGVVLKVFPGSEKLRYTIPFREPEETIEYLRGLPDAGEHTLAVMADDGEKFGVWPGTYKWVYEEGWLKRFMRIFEANRDWLTTTTFAEYVKEEGPRGRVYLPTCSYMEMGEWSLPTGAMKEYEGFVEELKKSPGYETKRLFVKGGTFRNFLSKYPESNNMHKRMLHISGKVLAALESGKGRGAAAKALRERMQDHLWQGQCNDAYWHGVFGGLYLPHLRDAVYQNLIKAEDAADRILNGEPGGWLLVEDRDIDGDLSPEVVMSNEHVTLLADPGSGGRIREFDFRPIAMNFMNTLTRREEAYHEKIKAARPDDGPSGCAKTIHERVTVKEDGLSDFLSYDWYDKASLLDHFLGPDADIDSFRRACYHEEGDFVLSRYEHKTARTKDKARLAMGRSGTVLGTPVRVDKTVTLRKDEAGFDVEYVVVNEGTDELNTAFGVEFNLSLLAGDASDRYFEIPGHVLKARNFASQGELVGVREVNMVDEWLGYNLKMTLGSVAELWRFPVETVSQSEAGFERVYQCSSVMPVWRVSLKPGSPWKARVGLKVSRRQQSGV